MPYYAGDYYIGDPGVLSDLWGKVKGAGKEALKELTGQAMPAVQELYSRVPGATMKGGKLPPIPGGGGGGLPKLATSSSDADEGGGRRYRRMNPLNPRALRRSMRRVQSFARFASRTMQFTKRHKLKKARRR